MIETLSPFNNVFKTEAKLWRSFWSVFIQNIFDPQCNGVDCDLEQKNNNLDNNDEHNSHKRSFSKIWIFESG